MTYGIYLYGILPGKERLNLHLSGLDQQPVHTHIIDGFTFLYSEAQQERYLASRRNLLGHEKVLEQAMQNGHPNLLPLQFGLIVPDWELVSQQLTKPYSDKLQQLFAKIAGHREVGIKVFWDASAELKALMEEDLQLKEKRDRLEGKRLSMEQVVAIGQEIEQAMENRQRNIIKLFQNELNSLAVEVVENDPLTDAMIYNAAYLIPWDDEPKFGERVEEIDRKIGDRLRIRYNNFTAPFNFVKLDRVG